MTIEILIFAAVILGVLGGLMLERIRTRFDPPAEAGTSIALMPAGRSRARTRPMGLLAQRADPATQLRLVRDADFSARQLLTPDQVQRLSDVQAIIADLGQGWHVMAQVDLTALVNSTDEAVAVLAGQRIDMVIVSADLLPIAAIESRQTGQVRDGDAVRDALRHEALRRAEIAIFEMRTGDLPGQLREQLARLAMVRSNARAPLHRVA